MENEAAGLFALIFAESLGNKAQVKISPKNMENQFSRLLLGIYLVMYRYRYYAGTGTMPVPVDEKVTIGNFANTLYSKCKMV